MTRKEIRQEAEERVNICTPYHTGSFIQGYIAGAEPRENKIADIKANCDLAIEGRDLKITELEKGCEETQELLDKQIEATYRLDKENAELTERLEDLQEQNSEMFNTIALQEQQIEKMMCCENCAYRTVDLLTFKPFCDKRKLGIENPLTCKCDKWELVN